MARGASRAASELASGFAPPEAGLKSFRSKWEELDSSPDKKAILKALGEKKLPVDMASMRVVKGKGPDGKEAIGLIKVSAEQFDPKDLEQIKSSASKDAVDVLYIDKVQSVTRGGGRAALNSLIEEADKNGTILQLFAESFETKATQTGEAKRREADELIKYYAQYGFKTIQSKGETAYQYMVRIPPGVKTPKWVNP